MLTEILSRLEAAGVPLVWRAMPPGTRGGATIWRDGRPVVVLDPRLDPAVLVEVAAHEAAHVDQGPPPAPDSPMAGWLLARRETRAHLRAVEQLVDAAGRDVLEARGRFEALDLRHVLEATM